MEEKKYKYNAFISYRHLSPDKDIASKLQKMLESYKPPASVVKDKKFNGWRIFRDETELPTSSNLSNDIRTALEASEFLIVICSEVTKDSRWCMEEIDYFKQLHDGNNAKIITVVVQGNPSDVFPQSLCNELIPVTDENGNTVYHNHVIEPLAANVAGTSLKESMKKLKTEFLRVASPLLGCGYDNLYNREHKKKVRRIITFSSIALTVLLLFAVYNSAMLWQINKQKVELANANAELDASNDALVQTNLELDASNDALIQSNRELRITNSDILANSAGVYLDKDDIYSAITYALEALPAEDEDIPVSTEAERVLAEASGIYKCDSKMLCDKVKLSGYVEFLEFSHDADNILAMDSTDTVYVIDYAQSKVLKAYTPIENFDSTYVGVSDICISGNTGYVLCNSKLLSINLDDGSENWMFEGETGLFSDFSDIIVNDDADYVVIIGTNSYIFLDKDGTEIVRNDDFKLSYSVLWEDSSCFMTSDGTVYIVDFKAHKLYRADVDGIKSESMMFYNDEETIAITENEDCIFINSSYYSYDLSQEKPRVVCVDKNTLEIKWETQYESEYIDADYLNKIMPFKHRFVYENDQVVERNGVLVISGRSIRCFDQNTGELYYNNRLEKGEEILYCEKNTTSLSIRFGTSTQFANEGYLLNGEVFGETEDTIMVSGGVYNFDENRKYIAHREGYMFALASEQSSEISIYHNIEYDNYSMIDGIPEDIYSLSAIVDNQNGIFAGYSQGTIYICDVNSNKVIAKAQTDIDVENMKFAGDRLFVIDYHGMAQVYDLEGNLVDKKDFFQVFKEYDKSDYSKYYSSLSDCYLLSDGEKLIMCCSMMGAVIADISGDKIDVQPLLQTTNIEKIYGHETMLCFLQDDFSVDGERIGYFKMGDSRVSYVSEDGKDKLFPREMITTIVNAGDAGFVVFVSREGYIGICSYGSENFEKIPLSIGKTVPITIELSPDNKYIAALCSNGEIIKYSVETLEQVAVYQMTQEVAEYSRIKFVDNNSLCITDIIKSTMTIIDFESMHLYAQIENALYFMKQDKKIIFQNSGANIGFGYYNYMRGSELAEAAKGFLERCKNLV